MARTSAPLAERLRALGEATELAAGRVDEELRVAAQDVVGRADRRLSFSGDATVVALAGATGSGKSSTFNALTGNPLAEVGVRRPTTAHPMATTWGADAQEELLDWLEIPRRHALGADADRDLEGLVLLDLPDHDSTEVAHRMEVDRLVELVDMLVWVVDPQKYADAALHERYLKPLAQHAGVMLVVLNQVDQLSDEDRETCVADLRRLLDSEGLGAVEVLAVSAATGYGLDTLKRRLGVVAKGKKAAAGRLAADVTAAAGRLVADSGDVGTPELGRRGVSRLNDSLAQGAGVPVVVDAVGQAWRRRGGLATGWPVLAWLAKFRPDPLRRLHLDRLRAGRRPAAIEPTEVGRTSLPTRSGVQDARVQSAVRACADEASTGLSRGWSHAVRSAARSRQDDLPDLLDRAVATTDLGMDRHRRWWNVVRVLQWVLVVAVVVGLGWLAVDFVLAYLRLPPLPDPWSWRGIPLQSLLVVGGILAGLLLAGVSRIGVELGARRRAVAARRRLGVAIDEVSDECVVRPVREELDRYGRTRDLLVLAAG